MRDDFSLKTIETLAKRVGCRCSNPGCRKLTSGPHEEAHKSVNIGVAAHITAAAPGGKRYDASLSSEERKSIENGMWLCQNCGKLIDSDEQKYSVDLLMSWKREAEQEASSEIENSMSPVSQKISSGFEQYLQNLIDRPQVWWLDEINDSTWHEFELFTKVQEKSKQQGLEKPQELSKPLLQAINDGEKRSILITGAPGAGKSTFLEKLAIEAARKAQKDINAPIPVLVSLKDYESSGEQTGIRGLIQVALESDVDAEAVEQLLKDKRMLLLIDGWNELSDEKAKSLVKKFCQSHAVIVTSRNADDYWNIQQKFEIQPLSHSEVKRFFDKRLPNTERQQLQELVDRVRDFGQTPLMVWMLFSIFQNNDPIPETRGEAYRAFTAIYAKRSKEGVDLSDARNLLGKLAFEMMKSPNPKDPTEFRLKVSEVEAGEILGSEAELDRMLNHLINQRGKYGTREISFCHQSLQEYYAAEYLRLELKQHPEYLEKQGDEKCSWFQHYYLNYTKWTELIALMLGLPEVNQTLAGQAVEQALDVDLMLGARLAGEVQSDFQESTVDSIIKRNFQASLTIQLLESSKSLKSLSFLYEILENGCPESRWRATRALGSLPKQYVTDQLIQLLDDDNYSVRHKSVEALGLLAVEKAIPHVYQLTNDTNFLVRSFAIQALAKLSELHSIACDYLQEALTNEDYSVRMSAAEHLGKILPNKLANLLASRFMAGDEDEQGKILQLLGGAKNIESLPVILLACSNKSWILRSTAISQITSLAIWLNADAVEAAIPLLIQHLENDSESVVRSTAAMSLRFTKSSFVMNRLLTALEQEEDSTVRSSIIYSLGYFPEKDIIAKSITRHLVDPEDNVRIETAKSLRVLNAKQSLSVIRKMTKDANSKVQNEAILCLGVLGDSEGTNILYKFLKSKYFTTRLCAAYSLSCLKNRKGIPILEEAIEDGNKEAREMAISAFMNFADQASQNIILSRALLDEEYSIRKKATDCLSTFSHVDDFAAKVSNSLASNNEDYQRNAMDVAKVLGNARMLPHLKAITKSIVVIERPIEAMVAIQANCKFYNYEIFHSPPAKPQPTQQSPQATTINQYPNATEVKIFEYVQTYQASPPRDPPP
jgi:HEAT repeat protein